jgi:hypothetical protein
MDLAVPGSSVSGYLCIEVGGLYFPSEQWYDYVIPVLYWWLENAMRLHFPDSEVKNIFMDGWYEFRMRRTTGTDDVLLTLYDHGRLTSEPYTVSYKRCLATLRGAAKNVLNELKELGVDEQGEASTLRSRLEHLMRLESEIKARGLP